MCSDYINLRYNCYLTEKKLLLFKFEIILIMISLTYN